MCYGRASGYTAVPMEQFERFTLLTLLLASWGIRNVPIMVALFIFVMAGMIIFGHWDIKMRNPHLENSVINSTNQELMDIHMASIQNQKKLYNKRNTRKK